MVMKKIVAIVSLLLLLFLSACSEASSVQGSSSSPAEPNVPQSSEHTPQESTQEPASASKSDADIITGIEISPEDADAGLIERLGENMLTQGQQDAMLKLVQNVVAGYRDGTLPLAVVLESEYYLNSPLPAGVVLPENVLWQDLQWSSYGEMWQMQGTLPLNDGNVLHVWLSQMTESGKYYIYINEAQFDME